MTPGERELLDHYRERIKQLEETLGLQIEAPYAFGLSPTETKLLGLLRAHEVLRLNAVMVALYSCRPGDPPDEKIVSVYVCKLRKKLKPWGLNAQIKAVWGVGWRLTPEGKAAIQGMVDAEKEGLRRPTAA